MSIVATVDKRDFPFPAFPVRNVDSYLHAMLYKWRMDQNLEHGKMDFMDFFETTIYRDK